MLPGLAYICHMPKPAPSQGLPQNPSGFRLPPNPANPQGSYHRQIDWLRHSHSRESKNVLNHIMACRQSLVGHINFLHYYPSNISRFRYPSPPQPFTTSPQFVTLNNLHNRYRYKEDLLFKCSGSIGNPTGTRGGYLDVDGQSCRGMSQRSECKGHSRCPVIGYW